MSTDTIESVTLVRPFYLDSNALCAPILRSAKGWRFELEGDFVLAELGAERHRIPIVNIAGMSCPRAASTPSTPPPSGHRDQAAEQADDHSATKQPAEQAGARARGRPERRK